MNTRLLLLLFALLPAMPVMASPLSIELRVDGIPHAALFSVDFDGDHGVAVGAGGQVLLTHDRGQTWTPEPVPTRASLLGVSVRGDRIVAVGQMGLALVRSGQGEWTVVETGTQERLMAVAVGDDGLVIAVGAFGALMRSTDGGRSWASVAPSWPGTFRDESGRLGDFFEPSLYGVNIAADGTVLIGGEMSLVLRSTDSGASFQAAHAGASTQSGVDPTIFGLDLRRDGVGFAVGQEGLVLQTRDGGLSWARIEVPTGANLLSVSAAEAGKGIVISGLRDSLYSDDGGRRWQRVSGLDLAIGWYSGTAWPDGAAGPYFVGHSGRVLALSP